MMEKKSFVYDQGNSSPDSIRSYIKGEADGEPKDITPDVTPPTERKSSRTLNTSTGKSAANSEPEVSSNYVTFQDNSEQPPEQDFVVEGDQNVQESIHTRAENREFLSKSENPPPRPENPPPRPENPHPRELPRSDTFQSPRNDESDRRERQPTLLALLGVSGTRSPITRVPSRENLAQKGPPPEPPVLEKTATNGDKKAKKDKNVKKEKEKKEKVDKKGKKSQVTKGPSFSE